MRRAGGGPWQRSHKIRGLAETPKGDREINFWGA